MINETELNEFMKNKKKMCDMHTACKECILLVEKGSGYCASKYGELTQKQIDTVMSWKSPVDWSKVAPDTKVVVWQNDEANKYRRYFAKYEGGKIYTYRDGATSWSNDRDYGYDWLVTWKHGELAEIDE